MARSTLRTRDTFVGDYDYGTNYNLPDDEDDDLTFIRSHTPLGNNDDDDDDYPIGDVIPQISNNNNNRNGNDGLYHEGNYYHPTHTSNDYDVYEIQQVRQPFYDSTTNKDEYYWKDPNPRRNSEDDDVDDGPRNRNLPPFSGETTNKNTYLPHVPVKEQQKKGDDTPEQRTKAPFFGETSHRVNYTPKNAEKPSRLRPKTNLGNSKNHASEKTTVNQETYDTKQGDGVVRYTARDNLGVGGEFFSKTTNANDFVKHDASGRPQRRKQSPSKFPQGVIDSLTTSREVYTPKKGSKDCPAAKLLLAQKNHKLNPKLRNGHFFLRIPKNYKNVQQIIDENSFPKAISKSQPPQSNLPSKQNKFSAPEDLYDSHSTVYTPPPGIQSPRALALNDSQTLMEPRYSRPKEMEYAIPQKRNVDNKNRARTSLGFPIAK